jgi:hypothetical protein
MAKSSKEQLAKDDRKIFSELQKNSNESIDTMQTGIVIKGNSQKGKQLPNLFSPV